ncbi:hypothetical protein CWI73_12230 [Idiomarina piscisalsi]|uniref:Restriction endonuclease n=2 Tax=Idiomarina piscisalsi TaxID=1096243 RepID=A0A432YF79_9GAMM|nr:hypothetical protein CWI73_12230 [Idiomarina piscisalsi]
MSQISANLVKRKIKNIKVRRDVKRKRARKMFMANEDQEWEVFIRFLEERRKEEWVVSAKKTLDWFLEHMGEDNWVRRKRAVVQYFRQQQSNHIPSSPARALDIEDENARVAFNKDWIAWYLYLVESVYFRPYVDEPSQSARIYPFFSAIGRYIDIATNIEGIDGKLDELLEGKENQPDSLLFEIVTAIMYQRNGWTVKFIPEDANSKTPDLFVSRGNESFYVECKRQSKVTEYSENERKEWRKRWAKLAPIMIANKTSIFVDVTFKVEISQTSEDILAKAFSAIIHKGCIDNGVYLESDELIFKASYIDMGLVDEHFDKYQVRWNSPQMIALFAGGYDSSGSYTQLHSPKGINAIGPDDDEHVLNLFCEGVHAAYCAKWECVADESINKKAKDVRKLLSKAVNQAPKSHPTIVHIGYETLHGPIVEYSRANKIYSSIENFDYKRKDIRAVYCHAIQPSNQIEGFECAETTMRFGRIGVNPEDILPHDLLLDEPGMETRNDTHWNEDFTGSYKS